MTHRILYIFIIIFLISAVAAPIIALAEARGTISGQAPPTEAVNRFQGFSGGFLGFLRWLFPVMIATAAVVATLSIIFAGFQWMAGAVSPPQVEAAKTRIGASVLGLAVALTSWIILNTINPVFVKPQAPVGFTLKCDGPCPSWDEVLFGTSAAPNTEPKPVGDFGGWGVDTRGLNGKQILEAQKKLEQKCAQGTQSEYVGGAIVCKTQVTSKSNEEQKDQRIRENKCFTIKKQNAISPPSRQIQVPDWCNNVLKQ